MDYDKEFDEFLKTTSIMDFAKHSNPFVAKKINEALGDQCGDRSIAAVVAAYMDAGKEAFAGLLLGTAHQVFWNIVSGGIQYPATTSH